MSIKGEIKKIEDRIHSDPDVICVTEQYWKRGFFKVHGYEDLGLLTREEVLEKLDGDDVELVFLEFEDNWRGGDHEREE